MASDGYMWALGLMSGTSLDGIDVALIETDGERVRTFGPSLHLPYTDDQRAVVEAAVASALAWNFEGPPPNSLHLGEGTIDSAHARAVRQLLTDNPGLQVDVIGYHGQTVAHDAMRGRTLQLGRGQSLADAFGIPVVHDFRSADVAAGGQGAPLAPAYHVALARHAGLGGAAILNLGGVGNVTVLDPLRASDTGPGNGPLDAWMAQHGEAFDADGRASLSGIPDFALLDDLLSREFFSRPLPRSADRYDFDVDLSASREDGAATLAAYAVMGVRRTLEDMDAEPTALYVCGGGRLNRALLEMLRVELRIPVEPVEALGWDGDMLEAQAFAFLAVRSLRGLPLSYPATTGVPRPMPGGVLCRPVSAPHA